MYCFAQRTLLRKAYTGIFDDCALFLEGIEHTSERLGIDERNFVVLSDRKIRLEGKGGLGLLRLYGVQKMP